MRKVLVLTLASLLSAGAMAQDDTRTVLTCNTNEGNTLTVAWTPSTGNAQIIHGSYHGERNTSNMGWSETEGEGFGDTEIYLDNGDVHNILAISHVGALRLVSIKQVVGEDESNVTIIDSCQDSVEMNTKDFSGFMANMTYVDGE